MFTAYTQKSQFVSTESGKRASLIKIIPNQAISGSPIAVLAYDQREGRIYHFPAISTAMDYITGSYTRATVSAIHKSLQRQGRWFKGDYLVIKDPRTKASSPIPDLTALRKKYKPMGNKPYGVKDSVWLCDLTDSDDRNIQKFRNLSETFRHIGIIGDDERLPHRFHKDHYFWIADARHLVVKTGTAKDNQKLIDFFYDLKIDGKLLGHFFINCTVAGFIDALLEDWYGEHDLTRVNEILRYIAASGYYNRRNEFLRDTTCTFDTGLPASFKKVVCAIA